jgi:ABC-2 type transport system ATP-binding protein
MDNIIEARNISKSYAAKQALTDINLCIPRRGIYGLLGPNGAGKTTFIRILTQIIGPDAGEIMFNGKPMKREDINRIGYMPEERGLYRKMKVGEQVEYFSRLKGMSKEQSQQAIKYWFTVFDIRDWWGKKVEELSKGMQQKVQFIATVIHKPELLILDEPFSGFDPINSEIITKEIKKLKEEGSTIVLSTHRLESVEALCDSLSLINNSRKILEGSVHDIRHRFKEHMFELVLAGAVHTLPDATDIGFELSSSHKDEEGNLSIRFKATEGTTANNILQKFMPIGQILSFKEVLPSINEIFIKLVNEESK